MLYSVQYFSVYRGQPLTRTRQKHYAMSHTHHAHDVGHPTFSSTCHDRDIPTPVHPKPSSARCRRLAWASSGLLSMKRRGAKPQRRQIRRARRRRRRRHDGKRSSVTMDLFPLAAPMPAQCQHANLPQSEIVDFGSRANNRKPQGVCVCARFFAALVSRFRATRSLSLFVRTNPAVPCRGVQNPKQVVLPTSICTVPACGCIKEARQRASLAG